MAQTVQFKRGSTSVLQNIIPAAGEPIWDKELQKLKVGDGVHQYYQLPYVGEDDVYVDEHSIVFNNENALSIFGFDEAEPGLSPVKGDLGVIAWKALASQQDLEEIEVTLDETVASVAELLTDVAALKDNMIAAQNELIEHENRIDAIEEVLEGLHPEEIQEQLDSLNTRVGLVETAMSNLQEDVDNVETAVDNLTETVEGVQEDVQDLTEDVEELKENSINLQEDILIIYGGNSEDVMVEAHHYIPGE